MSLIHYQTDSLTYSSIGTFAPLMNEKLVFLAAAVIFFAFLIRSLFFPLLFRKTSEDNSPALLSLAPVESMIGLYGIFNVTFYMMPSSAPWHLMLLIIGSVLLLSGALISLLSSRLDRMIIFSLISSLGCTLIGISLYPLTGTSESIASCLIHLFTTTIAFTLVLSITTLISNDSSKMHTASLRGFYHDVRAMSLCFLSASLGIAGIPAWSGYIGHALINDSLKRSGIVACSIPLVIAGSFTVAAATDSSNPKTADTIGLWIGILMLVAAPFAMGMVLDAMPDMSAFAIGLAQIAIVYIPTVIHGVDTFP
jgi:formate hydrogenlyase subunit 3/multisubunit Na+/H+ antiporter MnhD subunit